MTNLIFGFQIQLSMKKLILMTALVSGAILMAQCTPKAAKAVSSAPAMTAQQAMSMYTPSQLETGKTIFTGNCAKCHALKPETRTPEQWEKILTRMIPKAKLAESDGELVKAYIIANSKQG
jgi:cytochrome c5